MRSLRIPNNPNSPGQQTARRKFSCAALQWKFIDPYLKGYFDQLAKLHAPLMDDSGPLLSGISGTYTGYNLHRYAYIHGLVPIYPGKFSGFTYNEGSFLFSVEANVPGVPSDDRAVVGRVWYCVRPFDTWRRGTAAITWGVPAHPVWVVQGVVGCYVGMTGADIMLVADAYQPPANADHVIAVSSIPDGRYFPIPPTPPADPQPTIDPCAPPT
jgi:hypothetical protein